MASNGTRLTVVLLLLAALLFACWPWLFAPESRPDDAPPAVAASGDAATSTTTRAEPAATLLPDTAAPIERQAASASPGATTGSLLVHVVWGDDKSAAADVDVEVYLPGIDTLLDEPRGRSDENGTVLFADLPPGNAYPQLPRADGGNFERTKIVAGERTEVTLELKMGIHAKGRVVDGQGAPVAGAEIVLAGWGGGKTQTLGLSAADGTFALRCLPSACHIGARKEGLKPSPLRWVIAGDGATVEFTIVLAEVGGTLEGVVLDPDGKPVAGAVVRAGSLEQDNHKLPDGGDAMGPQCEHVRTDAEGRFLFASVVPGKVPVAARGRGLAPWRGDVDVRSGRRESLTIRLQPGVTLFGTVHDAAGAPVAKVEIEAGEGQNLGYRRAFTAADGAFHLDGLAAGTLKVVASQDALGRTSVSFEVVAGEKRRWDPVLSSGLQLRGRVLGPDEKPLAKVMVEARPEQWRREDQWNAFEVTDAEGRFTLNNCIEGRTLRLEFRRQMFPELVLTKVVPTSEELIVHLPKEAWVHIQGTVLGPDGAPLPSVSASPMRPGSGSPVETVDAKTGAFRYGPYPPGAYSIRFASDGYPPIRLAERALGPDEVWDVGTLRFQRGGSIAVQLVSDGAAPLPKLSLSIYDEAGTYVDRLETTAGGGRAGPLQEGRYSLQIAGETLASRTQPFEIVVDRETRLDVPVQTGIATTIECVKPDGLDSARVMLVVRDPNGTVAWRGSAWVRSGQAVTATSSKHPTAQLALAPGEYTIEVTCDDLRANGAISVGAPGPAKTALTLRRP